MNLKTLFLTLSLFASSFCLANDFEKTPKLVLTGEATIQKEADQMEVNLGVITRGANSSDALNQNNQLMTQAIQNLKDIGLEETEYQTCQFYIQPFYQRSPEGYEDHTTVNGYEVYNSIQVKTLKLDLADKFLSAAVQGGVNQINQISFSLHNPQQYREEAIQAATKNAMADAKALAKAAGVKIKGILNISLNSWASSPTPYMLSRSAGVEMVNDAIEPGKAQLHANVNVVIEIKN